MFAIYEPPQFKPDSGIFLFATEPTHKSRNVKMCHIYQITESQTRGQTKLVAIIDYVNVCTDVSTVRRANVNGNM